MELSQACEWGVSECVGISKVLYLYQASSSPSSLAPILPIIPWPHPSYHSLQVLYLSQGVRFGLRYRRQRGTLVWMGVRTSTDFTIAAQGGKGVEPGEDDPDERQILEGVVVADLVEGESKRAGRLRAVAKRAGIPIEGGGQSRAHDARHSPCMHAVHAVQPLEKPLRSHCACGGRLRDPLRHAAQVGRAPAPAGAPPARAGATHTK